MLNLGLFFHKNIFYKNFSEEIVKTPLKNAFFLLKKLILINKISKNALINVFYYSLNFKIAKTIHKNSFFYSKLALVSF
jgi:hypothetical protein